ESEAAMNRPGKTVFHIVFCRNILHREIFVSVNVYSDLTEEDICNLQIELAKVMQLFWDEIQTLRQVLLVREKYAADIRRQLGMSPLSNIKQNLSKGWQDVQTSAPYLTASATLEDISHSNIYMRTRESFTHAGQVTSSAMSNMGVTITRRLAEMRYAQGQPSSCLKRKSDIN
uniref:Tpd52 like 2a n=1 Tax=Cyclopterus lumpus TaxID=8103 RepID=A0A8C2X6P4_CYCLU